MGDVVAESGDGAVVVRSAPLTEKIRETINQYLGTCLLAVFEHQFLARLLALAVFAGAKTASKGSLDRGTYHYGAVVLVLLQGIEKCGGKAKVAFHELLRILRTIDTGKIEDKVAVTTPCIKLFGRGVDVVLINGINLQVAIPACLAFLNIIELGAEVFAYEPFGTRYQYLHFLYVNGQQSMVNGQRSLERY